MDVARRSAIERHIGSWSEADQIVLDRLQTIRSGPRLHNFRPYLVRALAEIKLPGSFRVQVCGNVVVIAHLSVGATYSPPERSAVVLFLEHAPKTAFVEWAVRDPAVPTEPWNAISVHLLPQIEHSIWFVPAIIVTALVLYQFAMPALLQYRIRDECIEVWALWIIRFASIRFDDIEIMGLLQF